MLSQLSAQCIDPHLPKMPEQPIKLAQKGSKRRRMSSKDPAKNPISNFPVHMVSETPPPRLKMAPNSQVSGSFRSGAYLTPAYSKTSTGISYSTHFITTYRDGKRKQIEVIDLTSDSNEPEDRSNSSQSTNPGDQYRGSGPLCNKRRKVESHLPLHENIPQIYDVPSHSHPIDDVEGHFICYPNTELTRRYIVKRELGQGTFGRVIQCDDLETGQHVAVKIIRAVHKYREASRVEIRVLEALKAGDPLRKKNCIQLHSVFDYRNHHCMVFDLLSQSVYDFLKNNQYAPFSIRHIQDFGKQLLVAVDYMHSLGLVHTDLKPENIMLLSTDSTVSNHSKKSAQTRVLKNTQIRLIDFGSAVFEKEYHSAVVSTRHYRAPEVIFGIGWSFPCDMWSVGCILVELYTGHALFQTHDNREHLALMEKILGPLPKSLVRRCHNEVRDLFKSNRLVFPGPSLKPDSVGFVKNMLPFDESIDGKIPSHEQFGNLIRQLLFYEPEKRITAGEALNHDFFQIPL